VTYRMASLARRAAARCSSISRIFEAPARWNRANASISSVLESVTKFPASAFSLRPSGPARAPRSTPGPRRAPGPAAGAHPVQHESLDPLRVPRCDGRGQLTARRRPGQPETPGTYRVSHRSGCAVTSPWPAAPCCPAPRMRAGSAAPWPRPGTAPRASCRERRRDLPVERQVNPIAVRPPAAGLVIADHRKAVGQTVNESAEGKQLQLPARVSDTARIAQQRRATARGRVRDATRLCRAVPDPQRHPYRLAPLTRHGAAPGPGSSSGRCRHGLDDHRVQVMPGQSLEPGGGEQPTGSPLGPRFPAAPGQQRRQEQR
jgi:hypothetical protein